MCMREFTDFPRLENGYVDKFLGTSFDIVYAVYNDLGIIETVPATLTEIKSLNDNINNQVTKASDIYSSILTLEVSAKTSADSALSNAAASKQNADNALLYANNAGDSANTANSKATDAKNYADNANSYAINSSNSANQSKEYRDELSAQVTDLQARYADVLNAETNAANSEGNARNAAANAATSEANAKASEQLAEQLTKSALEAAKTFPDIATGLANTTNGEFFNVIGSGDVAVSSYINDNGTAKFQSSTPSYSYVKSLEDTKVSKAGDTVNGDLLINGVSSVVNNFGINSPNKTYKTTLTMYDSGAAAFGVGDTNGNYSAFLISNPSAGLDLYSSNQTVSINGARLLTVNDMGAGNGLVADTLRGLTPDYFATASALASTNTDVSNRILTQINVDNYNKKVLLMTTRVSDNRLHYWYDTGSNTLANYEDLSNYYPMTGGDSLGMLSANGVLRSRATGNNAIQLDFHADNDGVSRGYATNGTSASKLFLAVNPVGNLDLYGANELMYNGQKVLHIGNLGAGSGNDADTFRGHIPDYFGTAQNITDLQTQINNRVINQPKDDGANAPINLLSWAVSQSRLHYWSAYGEHSVANVEDLSNYLPLTGGTLSNVLEAGYTIRALHPNGTAFSANAGADGIVRLFSRQNGGDWKAFITANNTGNLDLNGNGELFYNAQKVFHIGNVGAGSGNDADLFRGNTPDFFAKQADIANLWNNNNTKVGKVSANNTPLQFGITDDKKFYLQYTDSTGATKTIWFGSLTWN